jgi:hypothetical protein
VMTRAMSKSTVNAVEPLITLTNLKKAKAEAEKNTASLQQPAPVAPKCKREPTSSSCKDENCDCQICNDSTQEVVAEPKKSSRGAQDKVAPKQEVKEKSKPVTRQTRSIKGRESDEVVIVKEVAARPRTRMSTRSAVAAAAAKEEEDDSVLYMTAVSTPEAATE